MDVFDLIDGLNAQTCEADQARLAGLTLKDQDDAHATLRFLSGEQAPVSTGKKELVELLKSKTDPALLALSESYCGQDTEALALLWPGAPSNRIVTVDWLCSAPQVDIPALFDATPHHHRPLLFDMISRKWQPPLTPRAAIMALALATHQSLDAAASTWHDGTLPPYGFRLAHPVERSEQATLDGRPEWNWRGIKLIVSSDPSPAAFTARGEALPGMAAIARALPPFTQVEAVMLAQDSEQKALRRKAKSALKAKECTAIEVTDLLVLNGTDISAEPYKTRIAALETLNLLPPFQRTPYDPATPNPLAFGTIHKSADAPYGDSEQAWTVVPPVRKTARLYLLSWQRGEAGLGIDWGQGTARLGEAPPPDDGAVLQAIKAHVKAHTVAKHGPVHEIEQAAPLVLTVSATALRPAPRRTTGFVLFEPRIEAVAEGPAEALSTIRARFNRQPDE